MKAREPTVQRTHGLVSTLEWTGVPLSTLKQTGLKAGAAWILAEGSDAAVMTRSVPVDKCLSDALIVFAQNGEAIRPLGGQHLDQVAAKTRGQRKTLLHARGDVEVHGLDHQNR